MHVVRTKCFNESCYMYCKYNLYIIYVTVIATVSLLSFYAAIYDSNSQEAICFEIWVCLWHKTNFLQHAFKQKRHWKNFGYFFTVFACLFLVTGHRLSLSKSVKISFHVQFVMVFSENEILY